MCAHITIAPSQYAGTKYTCITIQPFVTSSAYKYSATTVYVNIYIYAHRYFK